ncbi:expressed unknown protein [Seminavis robusta]|uniref:Uncharacterized protein n=1 Tax=Seminavis robusta TaxID=568900 RepID=A0A9N8D5J8_9STRA|nr:expressed unknown protein [Seminavis robusta]|eukprot:Sro9_g007730.1 n/a (217) ;mRNA; f:232527-233177
MVSHRFALFLLFSTVASGFSPTFLSHPPVRQDVSLWSSTADEATAVSIDAKEAVKLFGRLADKYIMLDSSGGMCCYSACSDCEYRLPGGGYRMADQSSSRPKWICSYDERNFETLGKEHTSKWNTDIFTNGPAVTKEEFIQAMVDIPYNPPLGGPYVGASSATIEDTTGASLLFDLLAGKKEKLTKYRMGTRIKELAGGEEGLTWAGFSAAMMPEA